MPESQNFEARKESWRSPFLCKSLLKHVPVALNIHTTGDDLLGVAFSNQASKNLYKENCQDSEPDFSRMTHIRERPDYQRW
jgi:hypothetical protein